jgi:hypothetical protein
MHSFNRRRFWNIRPFWFIPAAATPIVKPLPYEVVFRGAVGK